MKIIIKPTLFLLLSALLMFLPILAFASSESPSELLSPGGKLGILALGIFVSAYLFIPFESQIHLRKSKPVLVSAGLIWILVALEYASLGDTHTAEVALRHGILEYAELFLFLLTAMVYINSLEDRNVFDLLRVYLISRGFGYKKIFWLTGLLAFVISPIADNLTTALLMGAVVMAVGKSDKKFVSVACVNIVVAANAGGAFSPFGDITTLMVWQSGKVSFTQFFQIFIPSLVNWLVPAFLLARSIGDRKPEGVEEEVRLRYGAVPMIFLFLLTITMAVCFHSFLHLPPAAGMMFGLGLLGVYAYYVKIQEGRLGNYDSILGAVVSDISLPFRHLHGEPEVMVRIVDNLHSPAFAIDKDHKVVAWNQELEKMTGISAESQIDKSEHWQVFSEKKRPLLADLVLEGAEREEYDELFPGRFQKEATSGMGYSAVGHFKNLGESGKWLVFNAVPFCNEDGEKIGAIEVLKEVYKKEREDTRFDLMRRIARAEWDTLLFFYGVILSVGGLAQFGYLNIVSKFLYTDLGPTGANVIVGVLSALVDNIPVMFAVLKMDPTMGVDQWLLVTLTAGVGGSLLAIGSAAGVALLGTARGAYTFGSHLRWTPVIALGYGLSVVCHLLLTGF